MKEESKTCKYKKFLLHKLLGKTVEYINNECAMIFKAKVSGIEVNKVFLNNGDKVPVTNIIKNKEQKEKISWILAQIRIERNEEKVKQALWSIYSMMQQIEQDKEI